MAIKATSLEYWGEREADVETSRAVKSTPTTPWDVWAAVRVIFGHDIISDAEMAQGYREQAALDVEIAESNLAAAFEILPRE